MPGRGHGWRRRWRMTGPRACIMDIFRKHRGHLTAEEVYEMARRFYPGIGIATVYRNLDFLTGIDFLNKYISPDGKARYEYREHGKEEHPHFICKNCGRILNIEDMDEDLKRLLKREKERIEKKHGFMIDEIQLRFLGLCNECNKRR